MIQDVWAKLRTLNDQGVLDALVALGGRIYYVSPQGSDSGDGSIDNPVLTLEAAYAFLRSGKNDAVIVSQDWIDGLTDAAASCTIRLDAAFTWAKPAAHLIGLEPSFAPVLFSPRARLAPTAATTAFANFFTVTGTGCLFRGMQWFHDFTTDTTAQIAVTVKGARNVFQNCHIVGCANDDAAARSLLITSPSSGNKGECLFDNCTIGVDTIVRAQASAQIGFAGSQVPRTWFRNCKVLSWASAASPLMITAGAQSIDRFAYFKDCQFINFGTALTHLGSFNSSQNGTFMFENPALWGMPDFGSTAVVKVLGYTPGAGAGIAIAPTA